MYEGWAIGVSKRQVDDCTVHGKPLWSQDLRKQKAKKIQEFKPVGFTSWFSCHPRCWGRGTTMLQQICPLKLGVLLYLLMLCLPVLISWWGNACLAGTWEAQTPWCWCTYKCGSVQFVQYWKLKLPQQPYKQIRWGPVIGHTGQTDYIGPLPKAQGLQNILVMADTLPAVLLCPQLHMPTRKKHWKACGYSVDRAICLHPVRQWVWWSGSGQLSTKDTGYIIHLSPQKSWSNGMDQCLVKRADVCMATLSHSP